MLGRQLSRWTLTWFAAALAFLLAALALAVMGFAGPGRWPEGRGLAALHLFAIGWLCQMMLGSMIQFVPVLCARPLALPRLALPALLGCTLGTAMLAAGFAGMEDGTGALLLMAAPAVLGLGFGLAGIMLCGTLLAARSWRQDDGRMVLLALLAFVLLWATGAGMALGLGGAGLGAALLTDGLPAHAMMGAGFWLTVAAMGVSFRLFPMFLVAPETGSRRRRAAIAGAALALGAAAAALIALAAGGDPMPGLLIAAAVAAASVLLYLAEIARIWKSRRRPQPEPNMLWSRAALGFLALAALLAGPGIWLGGRWAETAVFVALAGWLSTLTLAQMVKITSFLTWIQVFGPRIGRAPVPLVHELTDPRAAARGLGLWVAGVALGALALALASPLLFRIGAGALLIGALGLCAELIAIRRLRHLRPAARPAPLPSLILPPFARSSDHDRPRPAGA